MPPAEIAAPSTPLFRGSNALGWIAFIATLALFAPLADRLVTGGYLAPNLAAEWRLGADPARFGGTWLVAAAIALAHAIPGTGPEILAIASMTGAAAVLGLLATTLRRRGWPPTAAVLAALLLALHPVVLFAATSGQATVPAAMLVALLVLAIDRAEALGDAQTLIGLGLAAAALVITSANAVYVLLPALLVLPLALRAMDSAAATMALFIVILVPALVAVGGIILGSVALGLDAGALMRAWAAPLHGVSLRVELRAPWLVAEGGSFFHPFLVLAGLAAATVPMLWLTVWRLLAHRGERSRPATALLALLLGPLSGAAAVLFWHADNTWSALAISLAAMAAWTVATPLRRRERWVWLVLLAAGDAIGWVTPLLWAEADKQAWRLLLG